jgi:hypothetical protein
MDDFTDRIEYQIQNEVFTEILTKADPISYTVKDLLCSSIFEQVQILVTEVIDQQVTDTDV